jgi:K+-transporting ATPase KdpF subunit
MPANNFDGRRTMIVDYVLGGAVTVFLLAYLVVALIKPERF